jgi:hypothetical protein
MTDNSIHTGSIIGTGIAVGHGAVARVNSPDSTATDAELIRELQQLIANLGTHEHDHELADAEEARSSAILAERELRKPDPNRNLVRSMLSCIANGVVSAGAISEAVTSIMHLLG